jgi:hypothetical protein
MPKRSKKSSPDLAKLGSGVMRRLDAKTALRMLSRTDGWANVLTGIGSAVKDKRLGGKMQAERLEYEDAYELYRSHDMAARIVDLPADEMTRQWFDVLIDGKAKQGEDIVNALEELKAEERFCQAIKWARAYGGSGIVIGADDGQDPKEELRLDSVKTVDFLTVLDVRELRPVEWYANPFHPKYGEVARYRIMPQWVVPSASVSAIDLPGAELLLSSDKPLRRAPKKGVAESLSGIMPIVHESRVLRFEGVLVNRRQRHERLGWGDSVLNRVNEVLRDFGLTWASVAALMQDFARAVYKMKGLAEIIAANGADVITARVQAMELARSVLGATLLDADDEFSREPTPFSGVPDLLDKFSLRLASTANMPVSLLMGQSPAGLNATGDSDIRWWYDQIRGRQKREVVPPAKRLTEVVCSSAKGPTSGKVPKSWKIQLRPLWQLSDLEESTRRKNIADADNVYLTQGVVTPEEIAISRFGGDGYSVETQLQEDDANARALMAQEQAEKEAELNKPAPDEPVVDPKKGEKK